MPFITEKAKKLQKEAVLVGNKLLKHKDSFTKSGELPAGLLEILWEEGFYYGLIPRQLGGRGWGLLDLAIVLEELAPIHFSCALSLLIQSLGIILLKKDPDTTRSQNRLMRVANERKLLSFALSEDSEPGAETRAEKDEEGWRIAGRKVYVNQAREADWIITLARTGESLSLILLEKGRAGLFLGRDFARSTAQELSWTEIIFEQVPAQEQDLIGSLGQGEELCESALAQAGVLVSAMATGLLKRALSECEKKELGRGILGWERIQAEVKLNLESARTFYYTSAYGLDKGISGYEKKSLACKIFTTELVIRAMLELSVADGMGAVDQDNVFAGLFHSALLVRSLLGANSFLLENFL